MDKIKLVAVTAFTVASLGLALPAFAVDDGGGCVTDCEPPSKPKGNNGVGNGEDPQPPGNPPVNDGPGQAPGNPGNQGR